jgi:hypothetical protein
MQIVPPAQSVSVTHAEAQNLAWTKGLEWVAQ